MSKTLRSPLDRCAPLIFVAIGLAIALGVVVFARYSENEVAVWTIIGISVLVAAAFWLNTRFSPIANRRVCRACGVGASCEFECCPKCGGRINWHTVRTIPVPRESSIPALRRASGGAAPTVFVIPISIVCVALLLVAPPMVVLIVAVLLTVTVASARFGSGHHIRALIEKLEAGNGSVCTVCTYPRRDPGARCPECGLQETEAEARAQWGRSGLWTPGAEPPSTAHEREK